MPISHHRCVAGLDYVQIVKTETHLKTRKPDAARLFKRGFIWAVTLLAPLLGLVMAAAQEKKTAANPHASGRVTSPAGAGEVAFCNRCHTAGCPAPHPEQVKMRWQANGRVVLDDQGQVTCGSCHARGFRHRGDAFLARDQKGLCGNCHFGAHALSNGHASGQRCEMCHTRTRELLAHVTPIETKLMKTGVDTECLRCHYDGPVTHPIGVVNSKKKAPDLPLSADGKITCVTCHIGHKEQNRFGVLLRKDNRRGGLCLSCHDDL